MALGNKTEWLKTVGTATNELHGTNSAVLAPASEHLFAGRAKTGEITLWPGGRRRERGGAVVDSRLTRPNVSI